MIYEYQLCRIEETNRRRLTDEDSAHVTRLRGTVKTVEHGAVNSEVTLELPGGIEMVSIITKDSAKSLEAKFCLLDPLLNFFTHLFYYLRCPFTHPVLWVLMLKPAQPIKSFA